MAFVAAATENKILFPTPGPHSPCQPQDGAILTSECSGFLEEQSSAKFEGHLSAAEAAAATRKAGAEMLSFLGEKVGQAVAGLDPAEQAVDAALNAKGYEVVRKKFKADLTFGVVGMGSFGKVYKAKRGDKEFGIKMIEGASCMKHFVAKEIDTLGMVRHPAIVNYVETLTETSKDWIFIVMEFAGGGDLQVALINQPEAFDEALVRVMLFHICCAVGFAHQAGIMHRDMKPENVLLTTEGFPKVCDFGLSRKLNSDTSAETQVGTPVYMAPEINNCETYDFSVDTFAIGLILRDMMAKVTVYEWMIERIPPNQRPSPKKWPGGQCTTSFSAVLVKLSERMSNQLPGQRPSLFDVIQELIQLAASHRMPHPFWGKDQIVVPQAPPIRGGTRMRKLFCTTQGPNIAEEHGLRVDTKVQIRASGDSGDYYDGYVEYISHAIVPGAVHVRYKVPPGNEERVRIVDPMHYSKCLMVFDENGTPQKCQSSKSLGLGSLTKSLGVTAAAAADKAAAALPPTPSFSETKKKCCILQ